MPNGDHRDFIDQASTFLIVTSQDIIFTLIYADQLINHQLRISKDFNCICLYFLNKLKPFENGLIFSLIIGHHWLDGICKFETRPSGQNNNDANTTALLARWAIKE